MQTPQIGKIYQSQIDPSLVMYVESVTTIDADPEDETEAGFMVECCAPDAVGDTGAMGYEFMEDEWNDHRFALVN